MTGHDLVCSLHGYASPWISRSAGSITTRCVNNDRLQLSYSISAAELARALIYLASAQNEDGGFYQNFWINGEPYWRGTQLDETAFPILFAWRLHEAKALQDFDPYPVVLKAAGYLIHHGPVTPQERWEPHGHRMASRMPGMPLD